MEFGNHNVYSKILHSVPSVTNHSEVYKSDEVRKRPTRKNPWGKSSYAELITKAIESSPEKRLTLSQIYDWMVRNVPHFSNQESSRSSVGWKNSIRHNLSLHKKFLRIRNTTGKSSWWIVNTASGSGRTTRRKTSYRKRKNKNLPQLKKLNFFESLPSFLNERISRAFPTHSEVPEQHSFDTRLETSSAVINEPPKKRWLSNSSTYHKSFKSAFYPESPSASECNLYSTDNELTWLSNMYLESLPYENHRQYNELISQLNQGTNIECFTQNSNSTKENVQALWNDVYSYPNKMEATAMHFSSQQTDLRFLETSPEPEGNTTATSESFTSPYHLSGSSVIRSEATKSDKKISDPEIPDKNIIVSKENSNSSLSNEFHDSCKNNRTKASALQNKIFDENLIETGLLSQELSHSVTDLESPTHLPLEADLETFEPTYEPEENNSLRAESFTNPYHLSGSSVIRSETNELCITFSTNALPQSTQSSPSNEVIPDVEVIEILDDDDEISDDATIVTKRSHSFSITNDVSESCTEKENFAEPTHRPEEKNPRNLSSDVGEDDTNSEVLVQKVSKHNTSFLAIDENAQNIIVEGINDTEATFNGQLEILNQSLAENNNKIQIAYASQSKFLSSSNPFNSTHYLIPYKKYNEGNHRLNESLNIDAENDVTSDILPALKMLYNNNTKSNNNFSLKVPLSSISHSTRSTNYHFSSNNCPRSDEKECQSNYHDVYIVETRAREDTVDFNMYHIAKRPGLHIFKSITETSTKYNTTEDSLAACRAGNPINMSAMMISQDINRREFKRKLRELEAGDTLLSEKCQHKDNASVTLRSSLQSPKIMPHEIYSGSLRPVATKKQRNNATRVSSNLLSSINSSTNTTTKNNFLALSDSSDKIYSSIIGDYPYSSRGETNDSYSCCSSVLSTESELPASHCIKLSTETKNDKFLLTKDIADCSPSDHDNEHTTEESWKYYDFEDNDLFNDYEECEVNQFHYDVDALKGIWKRDGNCEIQDYWELKEEELQKLNSFSKNISEVLCTLDIKSAIEVNT
ncbi:Forkhead box protein O3, partial [Stegodyphus mimosarum]